MHQYIVNAALQILPISNHQNKHPYVWVDEVIEVINQFEIHKEVGAFSTTIEGSYDQVFQVIHAINSYLINNHCDEWILNVQLQMRADTHVTASEKVEKFRSN
jgi:uncharacterized protein (TIGR00106 family)